MNDTLSLEKLASVFANKARRSALTRLIGDEAHHVIGIDGLAGSASAMLAVILPKTEVPYLVIADDLDEAGYLYNDLCNLSDDKQVLFFPSGYKRAIKYGQVDAPSEILRTEVLGKLGLGDGKLRFIVTYPEALAEKVASRQQTLDNCINLRTDTEVDLTLIAVKLRELGFDEVDYVYEPGQFSIRGSLLDVFSFSNELPYRIDFFGDDIDSIRSFNVETQLSVERFDEVSIINREAAQTTTGISLLEFIDPATVVVCHNPEHVEQRVQAIANDSFSVSAVIADEGDSNALDKVVDAERFALSLRQFRRIEMANGEHRFRNADATLKMHCAPQGVFHKNFDLISSSFADFIARGYHIHILSDSGKQIERLRNIFDDRGENLQFTAVDRTLHEGFVDNDLKICVFTDHQIFDRFHRYNLKSDKARSGKLALSLKELSQIEVGDYIVHEDHGIGKFNGLIRSAINGTMQEMIKLTYLNGDIVFVSIHALHKLSKYRGKEGVEPRLSKLGSGAWQRLKNRTKSRLKDIARDLIKLYSKRLQEKGFAFSPDTYLQQELEASFVYEDTPDQLLATQAVKADMESEKPMDRLVCGDVGFGKTEIAIRAAFKAATDGKQAAVLVPTTVLAFQHYRTFTDRLKDFPVRVEYLSRARKGKVEKQILADLAEGKIDIIIGTHKLIGKRVQFKDLGLLVVDEEQKFGVSVKEKLRELKVNVDTLTMTATPIPRTLQFSLMGARDLSTLNTPPANRYPIMTTINALSDEILSEAINFELSRGGQVFVVNDRIEGLTRLHTMIERVVPDARVVVAHGRLEPEELEQRIIDFGNHDYDVLLATTIIENGIDMPNVNTIIINNANNYGLSDLHQLRGRVGRSNRKAFCYLLVPSTGILTPIARRRLQAIESFSDLGSGIHIAMQDLDIRGAGNLLGAEQSGFIADLGYETYQKVLKQAVIELKTQEFANVEFNTAGKPEGQTDEFTTDCSVDTDLELLFPASYVPQESERIILYRELDGMERVELIEGFERRLEDRFGKIPPEARELIRIVPMRLTAKSLGIEKIALKQGKMYVFFVGDENQAYYHSTAFGRILNWLQQNPKRCHIREKAGRRSFLIDDVKTVEQALNILTTITQLPPAL